MQTQVVKRLFGLEESLHRVATEREIERMDRVQTGVPEEVLQKLDEQSRRRVDDIQAALARIEAGTYGYCEICGHVISQARLEVLPMARYCVRCQQHRENMASGWRQ
jgi:RNA polymerase-binding transcription factor DksA